MRVGDQIKRGLVYCRRCRRRHVVRSTVDGFTAAGAWPIFFDLVVCPRAKYGIVPMRSLANPQKWMPV